MYNGIGLRTARGSGTSGHVQKNLSLIRSKPNHNRERVGDGLPRGDCTGLGTRLREADSLLPGKPRTELQEHERLRRYEVELLSYSEYLEKKGVTGSEFEQEMERKRRRLAMIAQGEGGVDDGGLDSEFVEGKEEGENDLEREARLRAFRLAIGLENPVGKKKPGHSLGNGEEERGINRNGFDERHRKRDPSSKGENKTYRNHLSDSDKAIDYSNAASDPTGACHIHSDLDQGSKLGCRAKRPGGSRSGSPFANKLEKRNTCKGRNRHYSSSTRNLQMLNFGEPHCRSGRSTRSRRSRRSRSPSTISRYHSLSRSLSP